MADTGRVVSCLADGGGIARTSGGECSARPTALAIMRANRSKTLQSLSQNAAISGEKTSRIPITSPVRRFTGQAIKDLIPNARQLLRSTRGSVGASSHLRVVADRTHSPEKPAPACRRAPNSGQSAPALARQISSEGLSLFMSATAAPLAQVRVRAR